MLCRVKGFGWMKMGFFSWVMETEVKEVLLVVGGKQLQRSLSSSLPWTIYWKYGVSYVFVDLLREMIEKQRVKGGVMEMKEGLVLMR